MGILRRRAGSLKGAGTLTADCLASQLILRAKSREKAREEQEVGDSRQGDHIP